MHPRTRCCPNPAYRARGQRARGTIRVHSHREGRYRCTTCRRTFAATAGTPLFRLRHAADLVTTVLALLCHGCPLPAIVATFGLDERTVATWQRRAGQHGQAVRAHPVQQGRVALGHAQADGLWVRVVGRTAWRAMAVAVPGRLWLGGVIGARRDGALIRRLVERVRACARRADLLVSMGPAATSPPAGAPSGCRRAFRVPVRTGGVGAPGRRCRTASRWGRRSSGTPGGA